MPHRKRRFEPLEDRRLLAALVGPSLPTAPAGSSAAETGPIAPASTGAASPTPAGSIASTGQSGSGPDGESSDNYAEYAPAASSQAASPSSGTSSPSSAYSNLYYPSASYDNSYSTEYAPSYADASKTPATSHSGTQPTALTPTLQPVAVSSLSGSQGLLPPTTSPGPAPAASPPAARSSGELVGLEGEPAAASGEPLEAQSLNAQQLVAPVALAQAPSEWNRLTARAAALEELVVQAGEVAPTAALVARELMVGHAGMNLAALEQGVDDVFDRLDRLGDELADGAGATRLAQWLVLAGGACAAFEYARARYREGGPWQVASGWPIPYEPRLRRRWFGRKDAP